VGPIVTRGAAAGEGVLKESEEKKRRRMGETQIALIKIVNSLWARKREVGWISIWACRRGLGGVGRWERRTRRKRTKRQQTSFKNFTREKRSPVGRIYFRGEAGEDNSKTGKRRISVPRKWGDGLIARPRQKLN